MAAHESYPDLTRRYYGAYRSEGRCVLEGFHPVRHMLAFGGTLESAVTYDHDRLVALATRLAPESLDQIESVLTVLTRERFAKLSQRSLSSPLLGIATRPDYDVDSLWTPSDRPLVFLDHPRNPGNVGAAIRVAAAADVAGLIVSGNVDPWSAVTLRSAAGLQYALPIGRSTFPDALDRPIVCVDMDGETPGRCEISSDSVLVIGSERFGLSPRLRGRATMTVGLPMRQGVSSLNLSAALSAVLYAWRASGTTRDGVAPW